MQDRTLSILALEAIAIQNASNLCGLVQGWHRAMLALRDIMPTNEALSRHPINKMWAAKVYSLACSEPLDENSQREYGMAYQWCLDHSK